MQLKQFSLFLAFLSCTTLVAQDTILSDDRKSIFKYSQEKINEDSAKLEKDWINPIQYSYTQKDGDGIDKSKKSLISISQPIFKSGGIYSAIKYANSLKNSNSFALNLEEKEAVKLAIQTLFNINKTDLLLAKQRLTIKNAMIDIKNKRDSVLNGLLDISFLNNSILDANRQKESLLDLEFQKTNLINSFNNLTAKSYDKFELPKLKLLDEQNYLDNNIYIKQSKSNTATKEHYKGITRAKYLPSVNANYTYTQNHTTQKANDTYGFSIVIPLSVNFHNDISSSKLDFLKTKTQEQITARTEQNLLKTQIAKIKTIDKKLALTYKNIKSYKELLVQVKELEGVGLKTQDDVAVFKNSKDAEILDIKIFEIDKQIELLELYARVTNAI